jgi:hypothetical protein
MRKQYQFVTWFELQLQIFNKYLSVQVKHCMVSGSGVNEYRQTESDCFSSEPEGVLQFLCTLYSCQIRLLYVAAHIVSGMIWCYLAFSCMNLCGMWPTGGPSLDTHTLYVCESLSFMEFSERQNMLTFDSSLR